MNKIFLTGNLTKNVEKGTSTSGKTYAKISLAVQRKYKDEYGEYETDFFNCIAWNSPAEFLAKYCKKGNKIAVVGRLETFTYGDKEGNKKTGMQVIVEEVELAQQRRDEDGTDKGATQPELEPINDDSLPF